MVDKYDNIIDTVESVTPGGAKYYFVKRKQMDEKDFDKLWKVMTKKKYRELEESYRRKPSSDQIQWWKEEETYLDIDSSETNK